MSADAHTASSGFGGRANRPGSRKLYLGAAVVAIAIAAIVILAIRPGGSSTSAARAFNSAVLHRPLTKVYGHTPKWIKIPYAAKVPPATASMQHPDLQQQQGYPVQVTLPHGSASIFMAGPTLPANLANEVSEHQVSLFSNVKATFTVKISGAKGTVPLSPGDFTVISYNAQVTHPRVVNADGGPIPTTVKPGQTISLKMYTTVPEGDGTIRWSPIHQKILVGVFWTTEYD